MFSSMFLDFVLLFSVVVLCWCVVWCKMELTKRFFDADGSRCIMFYYQSAIKDELRIPAAGNDVIDVVYIAN